MSQTAVSAKSESLKSGKSYSLGRGAALHRAGVALGDAVGTSFELAGCSSDDSNEGSDGEKGREAEVHLFDGRVTELDCLRGDGMLFADGELFFFIQRRGPHPLHAPAHSPFSQRTCLCEEVGRTYLLLRHSKAARRKRYMSRLTNVVAGWACHMIGHGA